MDCSWDPLAFEGVELERHNASVGAAVAQLLGERLLSAGLVARPLEEVLGPGALVRAAVLAGALHDMGKASPYYRGRNSFYAHEAVSALILREASRIMRVEGDLAAALLLELTAWAVARHHAAMESRHPLAHEASYRKAAAEALKALKGEPGCLLRGLPATLREGWLGGLFLEALERLGDPDPLVVEAGLKSLASYPAWLKRTGVNPARWMTYIAIASGSVIIADIIVAGLEGRRGGATDDGVGPAYRSWWLRELGPLAEGAVEAVRHPSIASMALGEYVSARGWGGMLG